MFRPFKKSKFSLYFHISYLSKELIKPVSFIFILNIHSEMSIKGQHPNVNLKPSPKINEAASGKIFQITSSNINDE